MDKALFIKLAEIHASTDYGDKRSVANSNAAADEMRAIVKAASDKGPVDLEQLLELLVHPFASSWVVFSALDLATLTQLQMQRCLKVIEAFASGSGPDNLGAQIWLKEHVARST